MRVARWCKIDVAPSAHIASEGCSGLKLSHSIGVLSIWRSASCLRPEDGAASGHANVRPGGGFPFILTMPCRNDSQGVALSLRLPARTPAEATRQWVSAAVELL